MGKYMDKYNKEAFGHRLYEEIMKSNDYKNPRQFAIKLHEYIGDYSKSVDTTIRNVNHWCSEDGKTKKQVSTPSLNTIGAICDLLDKEIGHLFGDIDGSTYDIDYIMKETGLNEEAIKKMRSSNLPIGRFFSFVALHGDLFFQALQQTVHWCKFRDSVKDVYYPIMQRTIKALFEETEEDRFKIISHLLDIHSKSVLVNIELFVKMAENSIKGIPDMSFDDFINPFINNDARTFSERSSVSYHTFIGALMSYKDLGFDSRLFNAWFESRITLDDILDFNKESGVIDRPGKEFIKVLDSYIDGGHYYG